MDGSTKQFEKYKLVIWMISKFIGFTIKHYYYIILVFPVKYRCRVLTEESGNTLVEICKETSERYEIVFIEIEMNQII